MNAGHELRVCEDESSTLDSSNVGAKTSTQIKPKDHSIVGQFAVDEVVRDAEGGVIRHISWKDIELIRLAGVGSGGCVYKANLRMQAILGVDVPNNRNDGGETSTSIIAKNTIVSPADLDVGVVGDGDVMPPHATTTLTVTPNAPPDALPPTDERRRR